MWVKHPKKIFDKTLVILMLVVGCVSCASQEELPHDITPVCPEDCAVCAKDGLSCERWKDQTFNEDVFKKDERYCIGDTHHSSCSCTTNRKNAKGDVVLECL